MDFRLGGYHIVNAEGQTDVMVANTYVCEVLDIPVFDAVGREESAAYSLIPLDENAQINLTKMKTVKRAKELRQTVVFCKVCKPVNCRCDS